MHVPVDSGLNVAQCPVLFCFEVLQPLVEPRCQRSLLRREAVVDQLGAQIFEKLVADGHSATAADHHLGQEG